MISAANVAPIEEFRFWHFFPDTMMLALGSWGYAFPVDQQRGEYATIPDDESKQRRQLSPERVAAFALKHLCRGVVWAYNEPAVSHEYVLNVLQASRAASRYTAIVTTGYMTSEALDSLGPYLDGIGLDLRGFGDTAYARLAGVPRWRDILETMARARREWRCHIEITLRLHHGVNDDPDELRGLVTWIIQALGLETPLHVLAGDQGAGTAASVGRARRIALENGLQYVYGPDPNQSTRCPQCGTTLITRTNRVVNLSGIEEGVCAGCGFEPHLRTSIFKR
jgi:pyruvate formate lyase activating enzyme